MSASEFWPFQQPELPPEKMDLLGSLLGSLVSWVKDFVNTVYWIGVGHGFIIGFLSAIGLVALIAGIVALIYFEKKRELAVGLFVVVLSIVLWYAGRIPSPSRLNQPNPAPHIEPKKPEPHPWRPFRRSTVQEGDAA